MFVVIAKAVSVPSIKKRFLIDRSFQFVGSVQRVAKISNSGYGRVSTTSSRSSMFGEVDSRHKRGQ